MSIIIAGTTSAYYGNSARLQTLAGATLQFYATKTREDASRTRWGFQPLPDEAIGTKLLGQAVVQSDGSFSTQLPDYEGAVAVVIEVERFEYAPDTGKTARGILGVTQLSTEPLDDGVTLARLPIDLSRPAYCALLAKLDLWLAAGRVLAAGTSVGVSGVLVTAFDRDITQDDQLGTATTDPTGSFEVFFPGSQFRQLPGSVLGLTSLELIGGPDLFFHVRAGTVALLEEPAGTGRRDDRENSSNCSYNELAVARPGLGDDPTPESGPTIWRAIGDLKVVPETSGGPIDFDPDGLTTAGKKALFGTIKLKGAVFRKFVNGEPIRYRFLVAEWANPKSSTGGPGMPPLPAAGTVDADPGVPAGWQALTSGVSGAYGTIVGFTIVGGVFEVTSLSLTAAPNANGWIEVDQRVLGPTESYAPTGELMRVDTRQLVPAGGFRPRKFSLVFQLQTASGGFQQSAQAVHVNNDQVRMKFELSGLGTGCDPFTPTAAGTIDIQATFEVEHPYLHHYSTYVRRHDGVNQQALSANETFSPASPLWLDPPLKTGAAVLSGYAVEPCSYEAGLTARTRLTTGETDLGTPSPADQAFCVK